MNLKFVFFALLVVSAAMVNANSVGKQATCLRDALTKISDNGKVHAFGIRSDTKIGDSIDIKSFWVSSQTGELELKLNANLRPTREEAPGKIETAEQVVVTKDLETIDPKTDKVPAWDKLKDMPKIEYLKTPIPDLISDGPKRDVSCSAWVVAPHVQFGTAWKFDEYNNRVCTQFKEVYRKEQCIENDAEGKCTKTRFVMDENAKRFVCGATTTESPKTQCTEWKEENNKSVCSKKEDFPAVRMCTDFTFVNNEQKCVKNDLFYPKFRCTKNAVIGGVSQCSKVEPAYPEFYCAEFQVIDGHRYCKTQGVYYGRRETVKLLCTKHLRLTEDNSELHCVKYVARDPWKVELLEFGSSFFTEEIETKETFTITRKVVVIPRPLQLLNNERSIQVTDVYIPVSSAKLQGETTILPGQIKEFAGMFGAITVDKYESLKSGCAKDSKKGLPNGSQPQSPKNPQSPKRPQSPFVPSRSTDPTAPGPVCIHPDEKEVIRIMNLRKMILTIEKDVEKSMTIITKDKQDFNTKCEVDYTKALRAKLIREFKDIIYREYRMIKMARSILRDTLYQSNFCPTDACKQAFQLLMVNVIGHLKSYIRAVHKSSIMVNHLRRMIIKPCCCNNHWEVLHTIKKYAKIVNSCKNCRENIIATVKSEVKAAVAQALSAQPGMAPVSISPPPKASGVPTLAVTRVLRGKEAILAYLKSHHKYFLNLLGQNQPAYANRFHSWRGLYNLNKRLTETYAPFAAQCQYSTPSTMVTINNEKMTCVTAVRRRNRYARRMNRFRLRLQREYSPIVKGTLVEAKPLVVLPNLIVAPKTNIVSNADQVAADLKRQRSAASQARLFGRKLVSQTLYGRKLQQASTADASLVKSIKDNLTTFKAEDKAILSKCF